MHAFRLIILIWFALTAPFLSAQDFPPLDSRDLLKYRTADGAVRAVMTIQDWQLRRKEILHGMRVVMGELPHERQRVPLDPEVLESVDCGSYLRQLVTYQTDRGIPTPAYLCIPHDVLGGRRKATGLLCLHPTVHELGHKVIVGLGNSSGHEYAAELAERGYVTLSPAYPLMANYWPHLEQLEYASGTIKAAFDNICGLDFLASLPFVDCERGFGAIGHSLGGHNAIFTAVFDDRIKVVVSSCGFDSFRDYYDGNEHVWFFGKGWCQLRYMPRLTDYRGRLEQIPFDFPDLVGALAPRTFFINAPLRDENFRWQSVDVCVEAARPVYRLFDSADKLIVTHPDSGHEFSDEMRAKAYAVIDRAFGK